MFKFYPVLKTNFFPFTFIFSIISLLSFTSATTNGGLTEDVLKYTNEFRRSKGLKALEMRNDLDAIARSHSEDMASGRCSFGHEGYNLRVSKVKKIIKPCDGYVGENVAYGARTGKEAFDIWKNSSGHRKNMLGDYKYIGIGIARNRRGVIYYTQIFVR
jgi:uncharacterized protein YkwD